jgi:hypothetical protein
MLNDKAEHAVYETFGNSAVFYFRDPPLSVPFF